MAQNLLGAVLKDLPARASLRRGMGTDAAYLAFEKVVNVGIGFLVSIVVIRYLGPEQFGAFSYVSVWIAVFAPLATLGLTGPLMKAIVQEPQNTRSLLGTALTIRIAAAVVVGCIAVGFFLADTWIGGSERGSLSFLATILALQYFAQSFDFLETYNQASGRIRNTVQARLLAFLVVSALRMAAVHAEAGLATFAWLVVLQLLLGFALMYPGVQQRAPISGADVDLKAAKRLVAAGGFLVLATLLNMIQARCEVFILERYAGLNAVGVYFGGLRFIELFDTLGTIAVAIILPRLLAVSGRQLVEDRMLVLTYRIAVGLYLCVVPMIGLMAFAAYFLLADKFHGIHWVVLAMAYRPLFSYLGMSRSMHMLAENRLRYGAMCSLVGLVIAVSSAMVLIPLYGIYGACISAFLGFFCSNLAIDALFNRRYFNAFVKAVTFR